MIKRINPPIPIYMAFLLVRVEEEPIRGRTGSETYAEPLLVMVT